MRKALFDELLASVREGGAIVRGEMAPGRVLRPNGEVDVAALRQRFGLSQAKFAQFLGINVGTLRNWEQRRREPDGPARVLLQVAARQPEALLAVSGRAAVPKPGRRRAPPVP